MPYQACLALVGLSFMPYPLGSFVPAIAQSISFPKSLTSRWLEVRAAKGAVTVQLGKQNQRPAKWGDRLTQVGDRISTGSQSHAVLAVDQGAAIVRLAENTIVQVQTLQIDRAGGNITVLSVPQGMAQLQVRPFNRPSSRLDIQTPAGVAGVRGTVYGVVVNPSGKTTVATQNGKVAVSGQNQTQMVQANQFTLVIPGQPPTPPQTLSSNVQLMLNQLKPLQVEDGNVRQVRFQGQVDPANAVWLNGSLVNTTPSGEMDEVTEVPTDQWISVLVRTPLGTERLYKLFISPRPLETPIRLGA
jgi:hypothetical protein